MKRTLFASIVVATGIMLLSASQSSAQKLEVSASGTQTITLNNAVGPNQFTWLSDAPLEKIHGTAEGIAGSFTIDPANPAGIRGTISAQVSTMKSGNTTRDEHLRSSGWLNAEQFPTISYTITSVKDVNVSANVMTAHAVGDFTMHGVTKPLAIRFNLTYLDESDKTRERAPGDLVMVEAIFSVSLSDFNVEGASGIIGSKVGETIDVTAKLFGSTE